MSASVDVVIQALDALRIDDLDKTSLETITKIEASLWFWSGTITRYQESRWRKERDCKAKRTVPENELNERRRSSVEEESE